MTEAIRVVLADDHALVRAGIRALLTGLAGVEVVGEADGGAAAIALVEQWRPDVLMTDIAMKALSGLEVTARVRQSHPDVRVLVLSMHTDPDYVAAALKAGAAGYLVKDAAPVELELALRAVVAGKTWLSPQISQGVVEGFVAGLNQARAADPLTARQREILRRLAEGRSAKEIAFDLEISAKTVETHRAQIMERLQIRDLPGLTRYAIRIGLVTADK